MPRLPVPGSDDGTWGDVLNDFLAVEHNADGTIKSAGSIATKADDTTVVHLAGTETITGNKNFTGTLQRNGNAVVDTTDIRLTNQTGYYPPQAYGFFALTVSHEGVTTTSSFNSTGLFLTRIYVPAGNAIARVGVYVMNAGTVSGGGNNGFAIYDDTGVQVAVTPTDDTLYTATGWRTKAFTTPIAAQTTGRYVYVAMYTNGYSSYPDILYCDSPANALVGSLGGGAMQHNIYNNASGPPASFNPATYATPNSWMPMVGLASS